MHTAEAEAETKTETKTEAEIKAQPSHEPWTREEYGFFLAQPFYRAPGTGDLPADKELILVHTSFTLYSYFEYWPFTSDSARVIDTLKAKGDAAVPGFAGFTVMTAPWIKTLDTITIWESAEQLRSWYTKGFHGEVMRANRTGQKYGQSPRNHTARFKIMVGDVPSSGDMNATNALWEKVLKQELELLPRLRMVAHK